MLVKHSGKAMRNAPTEKQYKPIIEAVCTKLGFDIDLVELNIIGADRGKQFDQIGIKLMFADNYNVCVLIGYGDNTMEARFQLKIKDSGGRSVPGHSLFETMSKAFGGRIFLPADEPTARKQKPAPVNGNHAIVVTMSRVAELLPAPEPRGWLEEKAAPVELVQATEESAPPATDKMADLSTPLKGYFSDLEKLHLLAVALVASFRDTEYPFGFDELGTVLRKEVGIHSLQPVEVSGNIRSLLVNGIIRRINPEGESPRYSITEGLLQFAALSLQQAQAFFKDKPQNVRKVAPAEPKEEEHAEPKPVDVRESLLDLRKKSEEYLRLTDELGTKRARYNTRNPNKLASEETQIRQQIGDLERRIGDLNLSLQALEGRKAEVAGLQQEIAALEAAVSDGTLKAAHLKYQELKALLV